MAVLLATGQCLLRASGGSIGLSPAIPAAENFSATSASNTVILFQTSSQSRDMEVSLTARPSNGTVFLRYDGTKGIYFKFAGATSMHIGLASGIVGQSYATPASTYARIYQDVGVSAGVIVCGVSGVEVYVKVDGVKVISFFDWHIPTSGYAMLKAANTVSMAGTATFLANSDLYSTPATNTWDIRDFGAKAVSTTGTISASSTSLVLADATQFAIGDHVVVEIGAEAGLGVRGTPGVGGTWPALSYANAAARAADTSQANNKWAYQVDTGNVYRWTTGAPGSWTQATDYYSAKAIPRSLFARITNKVGSTLTLSTAASVTATNATVHFENATKISQLTNTVIYNGGANGNGDMTAFETGQPIVYIPTGDFAYAASCRAYYTNRQFKGAGATSILRSPRGTSGGVYLNAQASGEVANNFKIIGNFGDNGFGLAWSYVSRYDGVDATGVLYWTNEDAMSETSTVAYPRGVWISGATGAIVRNMAVTDVFFQSAGFSSCTNSWVYDSLTTYTAGFRQYIQWAFQMADGSGGGISGCTVTSASYAPGFELFRMTGSAVIASCVGTNATISSNSSGNISITNNALSFTTNCEHSSAAFSASNPIVNINDNIGGGYAGSPVTISGNTITAAGVWNAANDLATGIIVNSTTPNVTISGGSTSYPAFVVGGRADFAHCLSDGANTDWSNITMTGSSRFTVVGSGNKQLVNRASSTIASGSSVTNCGSDYTLA